MRPLPLVVLAAISTASAGARAAGSTSCSTEATNFETQTVTCALSESRRYRFEARFTGGHDDTKASLTVSIDGEPLTCAPGSKTSLFGEDGDISLWCDIDLTGPPARRVLRSAVTVSHAQYVDFALTRR